MENRFTIHIKNLLFPCLCFGMTTGFISAIVVTAFKLAAEWVIHHSVGIYDAVRQKPLWLPLLVPGAALIGLTASFILSYSRSCRGGGIPTSVAAIRGIVSFKWLAGVLILPFSALLTYFCGVPLGTEGPCVQMGTAIGEGVVRCLGWKKHSAWRRYAMTGGASAGFSIATGSPITAIIFSMEELHKRFSPMLLTFASVSVITAQITVQLLAHFGIGSASLFHFHEVPALSPRLLYAPLLIGLMCGAWSILFTHCYHLIDKLIRKVLGKVSIKIAFPVLFAVVALAGFGLAEGLGSGHDLVDSLLHHKNTWYMLLLIFAVRMIFMMIANTSGVTGGVFLPTLAFGAIFGSLGFRGLEALGLIGEEHYMLMVILGITAFLGATSRIPITACVFAIEALGGFYNVLPLIIATTTAILVVEISGVEDFTDTVIESKIHQITEGKQPTSVQVPLTVKRKSFIVGKEMHDVLFPNSCAVVSFTRARKNKHKSYIDSGDVITVRYQTYDPATTAAELEELVGAQSEKVRHTMISGKKHAENQEIVQV